MPKFDVLDNIVHANTKVKVQFGDEYRNNVNQVVVFPTEFQALQREYPIFFRQSEEGKFYAVALLGLDKDENLFLQDEQWRARYIPAVQMRGPFALELRESNNGGSGESDPLIRIDMEDSRVNDRRRGKHFFNPRRVFTLF